MKNKTILLILVIFILTLGIGYALLEADLSIGGTISVKGNTFNVYFGSPTTLGTSNVSGTATLSNNNKTINFTTRLQNPGDQYEFVLYEYNNGTLDAMINSINSSGVDYENIEYIISYADDTALEIHDKLSKNTSKPIKVHIKYVGTTTIDQSISAVVNIGYTKATSQAVEKTINYTPPTPTATIGSDPYNSLQDAIDHASSGSTITLNMDIIENVTIPNGINLVIDLQNHTISSESGNIVTNNGTVQIRNGKILRTGTNDEKQTLQNTGTMTLNNVEVKHDSYSVVSNWGTINFNSGKIWIDTTIGQGVVNNYSDATFNMTGGQIIGGRRQAIYNNGGTVNISGSAYLENQSDASRACVHNVLGTTNIYGGTIISKKDGGVKLEDGIVTIGTQGGTLDTTNPEIRGYTYGVYITGSGTLNWYDGILKGRTNYIDGTANMEQNTQPHTDSEVIDTKTYITAYLEPTT